MFERGIPAFVRDLRQPFRREVTMGVFQRVWRMPMRRVEVWDEV